MPKLEAKVPPVVLTLCLAGVSLVSAWALPEAGLEIPERGLLALALLITGVAVSLAGVWSFRRHRTTVNPNTPEATVAVVTNGVYGLSRNPMYVGFGFALFAFVLYLGNAISAWVLPAYVLYMNRFQIIPEERILEQKFGNEYLRYKARVRRWL